MYFLYELPIIYIYFKVKEIYVSLSAIHTKGNESHCVMQTCKNLLEYLRESTFNDTTLISSIDLLHFE